MLLIPKYMILDLIEERNSYNKHVIREQTKTWGGEQILSGPILKIPYYIQEVEKIKVGKEEEEKVKEVKKYLYVTPELIEYKGNVKMDSKYRSIYKTEVYKTKLKVKGRFELKTTKFNIDNLVRIDYKNTLLIYGISDLKGMMISPNITFNGVKKKFKPGTNNFQFLFNNSVSNSNNQIGKSGIYTFIDLDKEKKEYLFDIELNLRGSKNLSFTPIAKLTKVNLKSDFPHPSFQGTFSNISSVTPKGFNVEWKVSEFNRNLPSYWFNKNSLDIRGYRFGVDMVTPINNYLKSERATKYMFLVITLTFLVFFLTEIINQLKIHIFQYTLVGIALAVFFTLLLALSEYLGFDIAYFIASVSTIILIVLYSLSIFDSKNSSGILLTSLLIIFGFIYTIIQMEQYSLLTGAIGIFVVVGITMYTTRKIQWYEMPNEN